MSLRRAALSASLLLAACAGEEARPRPPRVSFLVAAGDSTYWVRTTERLRTRGSPIQLARYDGRYFELYPSDDDRSYFDAVLVGQRLWRRDLVGGDSAVVFDDTTVASLARWYAGEHPHERPLESDEEASEEPRIDVAAELSVVEQLGPFLSYEYRVDGTMIGGDDWHIVRRGVVDLRHGRAATLADVAGGEARRIADRGRALFSAALDSVIASGDERAPAATKSLAELRFDSTSFAVIVDGRRPAILYAAVGTGRETGGVTLELDPIPFEPPAWWDDVASTLPLPHGDSLVGRWRRGSVAVTVAPDSADADGYGLTVSDSLGRRWRAATLHARALRLFWLDDADSATVHAIARAFDEATLYSEETRVASRAPSARRRSLVMPATFRRHAAPRPARAPRARATPRS